MTRYARHAEISGRVPDGVPAEVLRQISEAARDGNCPSVASMTKAIATLKAFLRQPGRVLVLEPDTTCPCHDPRDALDTLHAVIEALPSPARRRVEAVVDPLVEEFRARTLPDPHWPEGAPWWWRRITEY